ncbi:MAG: thaumatin family protein [Acidobacteriota bacterium]
MARIPLLALVIACLAVPSLGAAAESGDASQTARLRITNGCDEAISIFYNIGDGGGSFSGTAPANPTVLAAEGDFIDYAIPDIGLAATRFWPGYDCNADGVCSIGSSGGPGLACSSDGCAPPVDSKFEGTFGCLPSVNPDDCQKNPSGPGNLTTEDNWDTSMVDGYTLPYQVEVKGTCGTGPENGVIDCTGLKWSDCPTDEDLSDNGTYPSLTDVDLVLTDPGTSDTAGCYSPCSKLTMNNWGNSPTWQPSDPQAAPYCCAGTYGTSSACNAGPVPSTTYVQTIHKDCPQTYAYAYDDGVGLWTCQAGQAVYEVTFYCPQ